MSFSFANVAIMLCNYADTTSVNSGYISGVAVRLEDAFGKSLLQFACRHHISELVCGAA